MTRTAVPPAPPRTDWDLTLAPIEDILARLAGHGLDLTRERFREQASRAGDPSALARDWLAAGSAVATPRPAGKAPPAAGSSGCPESVEGLFSAAAFELWRRWAPDISSAEVLAEEFDRHYEPLDVLMFGDPLTVREALARGLRIAGACLPPDGPPDHELFEEIWSRTYHDLALWLRCLPQILAHRGLLDEAAALCDRLAPLFDARSFLADRAVLLAQAGRGEEARRQVTANVRAWRRDPRVLRKACETLWALGDLDEALLLYDQVLKLTTRKTP